MHCIETINLSFRYPREQILWENLNFTVKRGSFTLLLGPNGSGKSVLLRHLVYKLKPHGESKGQILFHGVPLEEMTPLSRVEKIAYVGQNPEIQMVSESVWQELAFSLENIGMEAGAMRLRIAEIANFFGIEDWFWEKTYTLSGGQKQILNVASALLLRPDLLILDEPDGSLDPVMRSELFAILNRLNQELGITILLCSHNWSIALPFATEVLYLENKKIDKFTSPQNFAHYLLSVNHPLSFALPSASQVHYQQNPSVSSEDLALTLADAQTNLKSSVLENKNAVETQDFPKLLEIQDLSFRYQQTSKNILNHLQLEVPAKSFFCLLGANGSGKSTLLKCLMEALSYNGKILWEGKKSKKNQSTIALAYLPQNALLLFQQEKIIDEIITNGLNPDEAREHLKQLSLEGMENRSPFDLSGGELQRLALSLLFLRKPKVLLLDEPTNNLSPEDIRQLGELLQNFRKDGGTVIAVSHNLSFSATYATHLALLFQGEVTGVYSTQEFFQNNFFYTTEARHIARILDRNSSAFTTPDILQSLKNNRGTLA